MERGGFEATAGRKRRFLEHSAAAEALAHDAEPTKRPARGDTRNLGESLLLKMGWSAGQGLGPHGAGIRAPIAIDRTRQGAGKDARRGLGREVATEGEPSHDRELSSARGAARRPSHGKGGKGGGKGHAGRFGVLRHVHGRAVLTGATTHRPRPASALPASRFKAVGVEGFGPPLPAAKEGKPEQQHGQARPATRPVPRM